MSIYHFAVTHTRVPKRTAAVRHKIAREVGGPDCGYTAAEMPEGPRAWGYCTNKGEPFDSQRARDIKAAWTAAGVGVEQ